MQRLSVVILVLTIGVLGQTNLRPRFADYPATNVYRGVAAPPKLESADQRTYRTMIRSGADFRPKFAGHYTAPEWGCGTDCSQFAVVDVITGKVYGPFLVTGLPWDWVQEHREKIDHVEVRSNSRLLRVNGCPNASDCGFYDYEIADGVGLKLLRKELLPSKYQPPTRN